MMRAAARTLSLFTVNVPDCDGSASTFSSWVKAWLTPWLISPLKCIPGAPH